MPNSPGNVFTVSIHSPLIFTYIYFQGTSPPYWQSVCFQEASWQQFWPRLKMWASVSLCAASSCPLCSQQSLSCLLVQIGLWIFYDLQLTSAICFYSLVNICSCIWDEAYNYVSIAKSLLEFWLIQVLFCLCLLKQMMYNALSDIL